MISTNLCSSRACQTFLHPFLQCKDIESSPSSLGQLHEVRLKDLGYEAANTNHHHTTQSSVRKEIIDFNDLARQWSILEIEYASGLGFEYVPIRRRRALSSGEISLCQRILGYDLFVSVQHRLSRLWKANTNLTFPTSSWRPVRSNVKNEGSAARFKISSIDCQ